MIQQEHIDSAKSYAIGASAIAVPPFLTDLTTWLHLLTMLFGFSIVVLRAYHDFKDYQAKREAKLKKLKGKKYVTKRNPK